MGMNHLKITSDLMWCHRLLGYDDWISKVADMLCGF